MRKTLSAGALLAQTTGIASLDLFDFHRSADVMLMLIVGGSGYLYGGLIGAALIVEGQYFGQVGKPFEQLHGQVAGGARPPGRQLPHPPPHAHRMDAGAPAQSPLGQAARRGAPD